MPTPSTFYTPVEVVGLYRSFFERANTNTVVWVRGIYQQRGTQSTGWQMAYDTLRDVNGLNTLTLKIGWQDRSRLQNNSLVMVGGLLEVNAKTNGTLEVLLNVTRCEIIKDQYLTEQDQQRMALKQKKVAAHYKNVTAAISQVLFEGGRPRIALVIGISSRTTNDFEDGLRSARTAIDFVEYKVSLTQTATLVGTLRTLDGQAFTAIAIYRGGGVDSTQDVDKPEVIGAVAVLHTPFISGVGHNEEKIFLREVADYWTSTPQGLGQFLSEIVENVAARRSNSRAVLVKEVEGQFKKQIDDSNKKNAELLKQIELQRKQQDSQTKSQEQIIKNLNDNFSKEKEKLNIQLGNERLKNERLNERLAAESRSKTVYLMLAFLTLIAGFIISRLVT